MGFASAAPTLQRNKKITGSGTPTDAVSHEPHQRVRRAPRRSRLAPTLRCGRARLSAFHHGARGSDRTPPLNSSSRASRDFLGARDPDGSKDRAPFSRALPAPSKSQSSEFQLADRSSCRPGMSRRSRPGAEVTSPRPREPLSPHPPASPGGRPVSERDSHICSRSKDICQRFCDRRTERTPLWAERHCAVESLSEILLSGLLTDIS